MYYRANKKLLGVNRNKRYIYHMCIKFDWQENLWGINFCGNGGMVGTIIIGFAKYARINFHG